MTAIKTMQIGITNPKAGRLNDGLASPKRVETDEPEESSLEWFDRWYRECAERRRLKGPPEEPPLTMEEIVAIVKEVRAERYAKKQENSTGR